MDQKKYLQETYVEILPEKVIRDTVNGKILNHNTKDNGPEKQVKQRMDAETINDISDERLQQV